MGLVAKLLVSFQWLLSMTSFVYATTNITFLILADLAWDPSSPAAQWIAAQEINNNSSILSNYTVNIQVFDTQGKINDALRQSVEIVSYETTEDNLYFPIVLGPSWSILSASSAPVLNSFDIGLMSHFATSPLLSDTKEYPYFYRYILSLSIILSLSFADLHIF